MFNKILSEASLRAFNLFMNSRQKFNGKKKKKVSVAFYISVSLTFQRFLKKLEKNIFTKLLVKEAFLIYYYSKNAPHSINKKCTFKRITLNKNFILIDCKTKHKE